MISNEKYYIDDKQNFFLFVGEFLKEELSVDELVEERAPLMLKSYI